ncbi:uncharacterized protein LOC9645293 isoform X1 [Selaginella moellendorffii]|uniref:uncharacterized protein LOC9645293 isoform X1 n=1 Tax=Selaginella moellendorffii TaxID=88036 RepID=UPI000D1C8FE2|nr:uncharacterized protein LOC9645293 isoform X1 [Selaginella moellendorffii]XP_024536403.1 uncharacterized protein LOC9645293 isoform X1 [Selaginella moellendorffii]|eukprot:XP_024536402.1 uncharacterized protein LOC9645293 isoform X1 [Selaginella moellendorffii]
MLLMAVCGCTTPTEELPTSRPPPRSRRKSSAITAARLSNADPEIARKIDCFSSFSGFSSCIVRSMLEELNQLRRDSKTRTLNAPLQKKYDDLENSLNKCKDDLRDLQRKAVTASPSQLRSKYEALGDELKKYKQDLEALHSETQSADSESLQKKYEALQFVLLRYRKDIEDELQKCWTQLKLLHLESQLASPTHGKTEKGSSRPESRDLRK